METGKETGKETGEKVIGAKYALARNRASLAWPIAKLGDCLK